MNKKVKEAKFPYIRTFAEMDYIAFSLPVANSIRELQSLAFIREGSNLILIGNPASVKRIPPWRLATSLVSRI